MAEIAWKTTHNGKLAHALTPPTNYVSECTRMPPQPSINWSTERDLRYYERGEGEWRPAGEDVPRCSTCVRIVARGGDR